MRTLPNMVVLSPADGPQTTWAVRTAHQYNGPVYIRLSRFKTGQITPEDAVLELGKAVEAKKGKEAVLVSHGPVSGNAAAAAALLKEQGIDPGLVMFPTIKPFDVSCVEKLASIYSCIVSIEEHSIFGGLGTAVAEVLAERDTTDNPCRLVRLGVRDTFGESGTAEELLQKHGLDPESIAESVMKQCR
jgi:transketolase